MRLLSGLSRFRRETKGNIAVLVAIAAVPLMICASLVLDLSLAYSEKSSAQSALDAAVLAAAASSLTDDTQIQERVTKVYAANVGTSIAKSSTVTSFSYNTDTRQIDATATGNSKTFFGKFVNFTQIPFTVSSQAQRKGEGTLEVALVLDNTWSMSDTLPDHTVKITTLKTAANSLVNTIMSSTASQYVKVAVVPYADYVNVGTGNRNQAWVNVGADYDQVVPQTCSTVTQQWVASNPVKYSCSSTTDGITTTGTCTSYTWTLVNVTPYQSCSGGYTNHYKWYGCVGSRSGANRLSDQPVALAYPGFLATSQGCLNPIVPLTGTKLTINNAINGLVVNIGGYKPETYIPAGLIWGVNVLSPSAPFTEGAAYDVANKQPRKTIILMTDGSNTLVLNPANGTHVKPSGTAAQQAAALAQTYADQQSICTYAKSQKIEIYTVSFAVSDQTAINALTACATDSAHAFNASDSASLMAAFQTIAGKLNNVRISG
jgi:Flp pilus assembly protein TadG